MNKFKGSRRLLWLFGISVVILGVVAALVVLPVVTSTPGAGGPDIRVPKMQNVPPEGAPRMRLDVDDKR